MIPSICTDQDIGVGALQGVVFLNTTPGVFLLNASTGVLTTNISMDYRRARGYTVVLLCRDTGGLTNTSSVYVTITPPPNYNPLAFSSDSYVFNVSRTTPPLYIIGQIMATDEIIWSTTLAYSLQSNPYFIIDSLNGTIQTISSFFDYPYSEIVLNATVTDGLFNDTVAVHMVLTPGNLNSPVFTPGERSFDINELSPIGTSVATFQCTDAGNGTNGLISYSITGGNIDGAFQINQLTGVVQVANLLILPQNIASFLYQITIQCSDHGVPIKSNVTLAYFNVYQDNALRNFTSGFIAYVNENANINDTVIAINASFQYPSAYSFINESVPNVFTIDANTGVVRVAAHLDHDTVPVYTMTVVAIWSVDPARNSSALLTIYVRAVNKYRPQCMSIFNPTILDTTAVGSIVLQLSCSDGDTGINGAIVFSLSMNYGVLGINNDTGAIYVSSPLDSISYSVLNLTVLVSDRGSPPLSNSYPIIIFITFTAPVFSNFLNHNGSTQTGITFFTATTTYPNLVTTEHLTYSITSKSPSLIPTPSLTLTPASSLATSSLPTSTTQAPQTMIYIIVGIIAAAVLVVGVPILIMLILMIWRRVKTHKAPGAATSTPVHTSAHSPPPLEDGETTVSIPVYPNDAYIVSNKRISQNSTVYEYVDSHDTRAIELTSFQQETRKDH
eukprot:Em0009g192a